MEENKLNINKALFAFSGVIGRKDYVMNIIWLFLLGLLPSIIFIAGILSTVSYNEMSSNPYAFIPMLLGLGFWGILGLLAYLALMLFGYGLMFRRIRDIRGTVKDEVMWFAVIIVSSLLIGFIPILNSLFGIVLFLVLVFKKGVVTSPDALTVNQVWSKFGSCSCNNKPSENEIMTLEKLFELKEKGALTEEEYKDAKKRLLEKTEA